MKRHMRISSGEYQAAANARIEANDLAYVPILAHFNVNIHHRAVITITRRTMCIISAVWPLASGGSSPGGRSENSERK